MKVSSEGKNWILETGAYAAVFEHKTFSVDVTEKKSGTTFKMFRTGHEDVVMREGKKDRIVNLTGAHVAKVQKTPKGIRIHLKGIPAEVHLMEGDAKNALHVSLVPKKAKGKTVICGTYPRAFELPKSKDVYNVCAWSRGFLVPGNWPQALNRIYQPEGGMEPYEERLARYGELFLGKRAHWWDYDQLADGFVFDIGGPPEMSFMGWVGRGASALSVIDDDQHDFRFDLFHPAGGPSRQVHYWIPSMGSLRYARGVTWYFTPGGDYVSLAKKYRALMKKRGHLVTLEQKAKKNPRVKKLAGELLVRARVLQHSYKDFGHGLLRSFRDIAGDAEAFARASGYDRLTVHVRGWQKRGHDLMYPDLLPPSLEAGGPAGFKEMVERSHRAGVMVELGGCNYHDITWDADSNYEDYRLVLSNGRNVRRNFWAGGLVTFMCPTQAYKFVARNLEIGRVDYPVCMGLQEIADIDGYWIGNYGRNIECYSKLHRADRETNRKAQVDTFQYIKSRGLISSTEHYQYWLMESVDRGRGRIKQQNIPGEDRSSEQVGIPVPLWQLVFHDAGTTVGGGVDGALTGAHPSINLPEDHKFDKSAVDKALAHAKLHREIAFQEMVGHRVLSDDWSKQETEFASGIKVRADYKAKTWKRTR